MVDVLDLDATGQAALVRSGAVSAAELVEASIAQVERLDPDLNAVIHQTFEGARRRIAEGPLDGPFAGVPILFKDMGAFVTGDPAHLGTTFLRDAGWRAPFDHELTRKVLAAGFVCVGRTNTSELAGLSSTESAAYGATANPWDLERSAGGSSGGSAAAIASRMVAVAHGTDGGGSIRIPASVCGLVGLKPSRGRVSFAPLTEVAGGFGTDGMLCRSVRDAAALLDVICGSVPGDPHPLPPPAHPFVEDSQRNPGRLRIAFTTEGPPGVDATHPACAVAVRAVAECLASSGHAVIDESPPWPGWDEVLDLFVDLWAVSTASTVRTLTPVLGRPVASDELEPYNAALVEHAAHLTARDHVRRLAQQAAMSRSMGAWWASGHDLLVTPTVRTPPPLLGTVLGNTGDPLDDWRQHFGWIPFTPIWNATGQPAISVPVGEADGLPVGVQLVAAYGREDLLLQVAAQLEQVMPWSARRPLLIGPAAP